MQYIIWIDSTPPPTQLLNCLAQWLEHLFYSRDVASFESSHHHQVETSKFQGRILWVCSNIITFDDKWRFVNSIRYGLFWGDFQMSYV